MFGRGHPCLCGESHIPRNIFSIGLHISRLVLGRSLHVPSVVLLLAPHPFGACFCDPLWRFRVPKGDQPALHAGEKGGCLRGGLSHVCVATAKQPSIFQTVNKPNPNNSKEKQFVSMSTNKAALNLNLSSITLCVTLGRLPNFSEPSPYPKGL